MPKISLSKGPTEPTEGDPEQTAGVVAPPARKHVVLLPPPGLPDGQLQPAASACAAELMANSNGIENDNSETA